MRLVGCDFRVSIHAPARGATTSSKNATTVFRVSIHAPARGATHDGNIKGLRRGSFNPRAREGRDLWSKSRTLRNTSFNPRAREGRDQISILGAQLPSGFNPRAREGRDLTAKHRLIFLVSFNPRAREGRDFDEVMSAVPDDMFQSTRPRGARPLYPNSLTHRRQNDYFRYPQ